MSNRWNYFRRILKVYLTKDKGYLSFWHEKPEITPDYEIRNSTKVRKADELGPYYMIFAGKADYAGPRDKDGVILFDYFFDIGRQYNPLAIAQYGLGNWNRYVAANGKGQMANSEKYISEAKIQAEWLIANLEPNGKGLKVWKHKFPWHYKFPLAAGWYSGHSQGTGISLLARLYQETKDERYLRAAKEAFPALAADIVAGGVVYRDTEGGTWLEEYLVSEPTRILNGYLWALWGVWDYWLLTSDIRAKELFGACVATVVKNLPKYDLGFWSRYDLSRQLIPMIASPYYHSLHIVQLRATAKIAKSAPATKYEQKDYEIRNDTKVRNGAVTLEAYAEKWERYARNPIYRGLALALKVIFKIFYF